MTFDKLRKPVSVVNVDEEIVIARESYKLVDIKH
jgi:acetate kinase